MTVSDSVNNSDVGNQPAAPATFTIRQPHVITSVMTYHWNDGRGTRAGTISLRDAAGRVFGPDNKLAPGEKREVQVMMTADGRIKFIAGRNGQVLATKIWNGDPSDTNRFPRVVFDASGQLLVMAGLR